MKTSFSQKRSFLKGMKQFKTNSSSMMVSRSALIAHVACFPPLDNVTFTSVSNSEPSFDDFNMLVSFAVASVISSFLEEKLKNDPEALLRLQKHFKDLNDDNKKRNRGIK